MTERPEERCARAIVAAALGVPVVHNDDGTEPGQVDYLIKFSIGDVPLEVIGNHDTAFNEQWKAIEKYATGLVVPGLRSRWVVKLREGASVKVLLKSLPGRLLAAQDEPDAGRGWTIPNLPVALSDLDLDMAYPIEGAPAGQVFLHTPGWSGTVSSDVLGGWVEKVLTEQSDVPRKLGAFPSTDKHAFIWATIGSDYGAQFDLEDRGQAVPTVAPRLPPGVTHVWVAGIMSSQGCLAWFPDRGWWRVALPDTVATVG